MVDFLDGQNFVANFMDLNWDGRVYEIDPKANKVVRIIDRGIRFTNGIAFDAKNRLYANASFTGEVYRYDALGAEAPRREVFGNVLQPDDQTGFKGPDGMKFGMDGRLYCTVYGQGNVTVLEVDGSVATRLPLDGSCPTNLCFSRHGTQILVTEADGGVLDGLQRYAHSWRLDFDIPVIGITGSSGKTTTKQMVASVVAARGPVLATVGNLNNHIGVPLTLLCLRREHQTAVIEMGASGRTKRVEVDGLDDAALRLALGIGD